MEVIVLGHGNDMSQFLIKWHANWADEFDTNGFLITSQSEWERQLAHLDKKKGSFRISIGSNQGWEDMTVEEFKSNFKAERIPEVWATTISNALGKKYGFFPLPTDYVYLDE